MANSEFQPLIRQQPLDVMGIGASRKCAVCGRTIPPERIAAHVTTLTCDSTCALARKNNTTRLEAYKHIIKEQQGNAPKQYDKPIHNETPYQIDQGRAKESEGRAYEQ